MTAYQSEATGDYRPHHTIDIIEIERGGYPNYVMTCHHEIHESDPNDLYAAWLDDDSCWFERLWSMEGGSEWFGDIAAPIRFPMAVRPSGFYEELEVVKDDR